VRARSARLVLGLACLRGLGFYGGGVVAACARETRLVFLLEADTEEREMEARRSKDSHGERRRINRRGEKLGFALPAKLMVGSP